MVTNITRKQLVQLSVVVLIGIGVGQLLQRSAPIGRDVSGSIVAQTLLHDSSSPSREVDKPTLTLVVFTDYQCPACKLASPAMEQPIFNRLMHGLSPRKNF